MATIISSEREIRAWHAARSGRTLTDSTLPQCTPGACAECDDVRRAYADAQNQYPTNTTEDNSTMTDTITNPESITLTPANSAADTINELRAELAELRAESARVNRLYNELRSAVDEHAEQLLDAAERYDFCPQYEAFVDRAPAVLNLIPRKRDWYVWTDVTVRVRVEVQARDEDEARDEAENVDLADAVYNLDRYSIDVTESNVDDVELA